MTTPKSLEFKFSSRLICNYVNKYVYREVQTIFLLFYLSFSVLRKGVRELDSLSDWHTSREGQKYEEERGAAQREHGSLCRQLKGGSSKGLA